MRQALRQAQPSGQGKEYGVKSDLRLRLARREARCPSSSPPRIVRRQHRPDQTVTPGISGPVPGRPRITPGPESAANQPDEQTNQAAEPTPDLPRLQQPRRVAIEWQDRPGWRRFLWCRR
jgi:hypothetical protein